MNVRVVFWIKKDEWFHGSFKIRLHESVDLSLVRRMRTRGQRLEGGTIYVPGGRARDTNCGMLEFKDRFGMPFGWKKTLVDDIVADDGGVLWRR